MKKNNADTADLDLFKEWAKSVTPLRHHDKAVHARSLPKPIPKQRIRDERQVLADSLSPHPSWDAGLETGEELSYARNGVSRDVLKQLKRGKWVVQAELDLHGLNRLEARESLADFLSRCLKKGARCVRIVHGKGLRSAQRQPVLKGLVKNWLIQRNEVLAFSQARGVDGGGGAVLVLLRG